MVESLLASNIRGSFLPVIDMRGNDPPPLSEKIEKLLRYCTVEIGREFAKTILPTSAKWSLGAMLSKVAAVSQAVAPSQISLGLAERLDILGVLLALQRRVVVVGVGIDRYFTIATARAASGAPQDPGQPREGHRGAEGLYGQAGRELELMGAALAFDMESLLVFQETGEGRWRGHGRMFRHCSHPSRTSESTD